MITIIYNEQGNPVEVTSEGMGARYQELKARGWETQDRHDWETMEDATAAAATASQVTGEVYLPVDNGEWVSPRYDIVQPPKVGDEVSYAFNGDYYPCGKVVRVTEGTFKVVTTDTGDVFYRRRQSAAWIKQGGTWSLVQGHINRRNPSF